jgi:adenylate kinase
MAKRLLVFGPPGVGKGTHSRRLASDLGIPHLSTGDLLRRAIAEGSSLGQRAAVHMNAGALVPDEVAYAVLQQRLALPDTARGYLLDGFPRNLDQARVFDRLASVPGDPSGPGGPSGQRPADPAGGDAVLALDAPEPVLVERLTGRQTCSACAATFNRATNPARVEGQCDVCGGRLITRPDDQPETVRRRLQAYQAATAPVLGFLAQKGWPVRAVPSVGEVSDVYSRILAAGSQV